MFCHLLSFFACFYHRSTIVGSAANPFASFIPMNIALSQGNLMIFVFLFVYREGTVKRPNNMSIISGIYLENCETHAQFILYIGSNQTANRDAAPSALSSLGIYIEQI
jgi:hypothetical protein